MGDKQAVPLLTAEQASTIAEVYKLPFMRAQVEAIATGKAVVIPHITREALEKALRDEVGIRGGSFNALMFSGEEIVSALKKLEVNIIDKPKQTEVQS